MKNQTEVTHGLKSCGFEGPYIESDSAINTSILHSYFIKDRIIVVQNFP